MAKTNISFNNKNYSIDEASLSTATAALQSHLSTVMNGTGAVINLGGVSYNVDSAKLLAATNDFISHLGTVAGSGKKVVINGVEYNVDSDKMASAISELHTVLGGLHTDDGDDGALPEKNEYGFYYNVPYVATPPFEYYTEKIVFYEDNTMLAFDDYLFTFDGFVGFFTEQTPANFVYDEVTRSAINEWDITHVFSENGECMDNDFGHYVVSGAETEHGVYYDSPYINKYGDVVTFTDNGASQIMIDGETFTITGIEWLAHGHHSEHPDMDKAYISIDGNVMFWKYELWTREM